MAIRLLTAVSRRTFLTSAGLLLAGLSPLGRLLRNAGRAEGLDVAMSYVGVSTVDITMSANWLPARATISPPAGYQSGDLLLLCVYYTPGRRSLVATGEWREIHKLYSGTTPVCQDTRWKIARANEPICSLTFSSWVLGGTAVILAYRGVSLAYGSPIICATGQANIFSAPIATPPANVILPAGKMLVALFATDDFGFPSFEPPVGMTERFDQANYDCAGCGADKLLISDTIPEAQACVSTTGGVPSVGLLLGLKR